MLPLSADEALLHLGPGHGVEVLVVNVQGEVEERLDLPELKKDTNGKKWLKRST